MRLLIIENRRHISIIITNDDDETYRKTTGELGMIDENKLFFSFIDRQRCATREAFFTIFRKKKNSTHIRYLCIVQMAKPIKKTSICVEIHLSKWLDIIEETSSQPTGKNVHIFFAVQHNLFMDI